jgi:hypothetical protein
MNTPPDIAVDLSGDWRAFAQPLSGFEMIGTVRTPHSGEGALARSLALGLYVQVNGAAIIRIDQEALARALSASNPNVVS